MAPPRDPPRPQPPSNPSLLIGGSYELDAAQPLHGLGGGLQAFAVRDHRHGRTDLMAVQTLPDAPPRPLPLTTLAGSQIENMLLPLAHGRAATPGGGQGWFVVTPRPPGTALSSLIQDNACRPWGEGELLDCVLRPAALALDQLAASGVTHRAIRLDNLFRSRPAQSITLGCAWAGPPGLLQPALYEPPSMAMCHRHARGDGEIADDVYALGVVLVILASGRMPLEGLDDAAVIQAKLERGSFAALTADLRLPAGISDLVRGMLAEDPDHRPPPVLLADPMAARARRVAARPAQRAQRPVELGRIQAWDARMLAFAIARAPDQGIRLLRGHVLESWLRRTLGDSGLASRIEEAVRLSAIDHALDPVRSDLTMVMRAVAILDPLAPLCWGEVALFPDGIGPLLAYASGGQEPARRALLAPIEAIVQTEAPALWADARPGRSDPNLIRMDARQQRLMLRISGWSGGLVRLAYAINPLLACRSQMVGRECVVRLHELVPALERNAASAGDLVIDQEIAGFISARFNGRMDADFTILSQDEDPDIDPPGHRGMAQLRVLAKLSAQDPALTWPRLAACAPRAARAALAQWRGQANREARRVSLEAAAERGAITAMLAVLEDTQARSDDLAAAQEAEAELRRINAELETIVARRPVRADIARNTGQEIAAALGVVALATAAVLAAMS